MPDLADTLFATKPLVDHYGEYQGGINEWWESSVDEPTRQRHDAFYGDSPNVRAMNVNKPFIGEALGVDEQELSSNYDQYRSHFSTQLGLAPDTNDEQLWGAISTIAKKRKEEFGLLDDAWNTGAKAAAESRYPFETWGEWSEGKKVGDREKAHLVRAWSEESKKLDRMRPMADKFIREVESSRVTGAPSEYGNKTEVIKDISGMSDKDFATVLSIMRNHTPVTPAGDKSMGQRGAEQIGRVLESIGSGAVTAPKLAELSITESFISKSDHYFFDEEKFKKLTEDGHPFAFYESVHFSGAEGERVRKNMDDATRSKIQEEIDGYGKFIDRVDMLRKVGKEKVDPTKSGKYWEDLLVDVAEVAGYSIPTLLTGGAASAAGFGTAAAISIGAQPMVGMFMQDKLTEMQFDQAYANVSYGNKVKLAFAAGEFDSLVESVSDIAQFTRLGKLGNFVTKMKSPTARFITRTGANVGMEITEETIQQMSLPIGTEIAQWFDDNMPEVALKEKLGEFLTADNLGHLALVVLPYAIIGAGTKELGADLQKFNLYVEENKDDLQAKYSNVKALSLIHDDKTAKEIATLAKEGKVGEALMLSANSEMQARVPTELTDTTAQKSAFKDRLVSQGFGTEAQAEEYAEVSDHIIRLTAARSGVPVEDVYAGIDLTRDAATGEVTDSLDQSAAVDRATALREAINIDDDAAATQAMVANLPSVVTIEEVTDPAMPDEPMYRALLGSPAEVVGQTDNDALLLGEFGEAPSLAQVKEAITDGIGEGLITDADVAGITLANATDSLDQSAYHGTPFEGDIEQFMTDHIGTGEGAQVYGWGLYFAESPGVAKHYYTSLGQYMGRDLMDGVKAAFTAAKGQGQSAASVVQSYQQTLDGKAAASIGKMLGDTRLMEDLEKHLSEGRFFPAHRVKPYINISKGGLYQVELDVDDSNVLLWDKTLSEQPEIVQRALKEYWDGNYNSYTLTNDIWNDVFEPGSYITAGQMVRRLGGDKSLSKALEKAGVHGIKYLDGTSRKEGKGTYNYVIFDGKYVNQVNRLEQGKKGSIDFLDDLKAIIRITEDGDASTFIHELGHFARRHALTDANQKALALTYGVDVDNMAWTRDAEEKFARDFERYFYDGKAPEGATPALKKAFKAIKEFMREVYTALKGSPIAKDLDPAVTKVLDDLFSSDPVEVDAINTGIPSLVEALDQGILMGGADTSEWANLKDTGLLSRFSKMTEKEKIEAQVDPEKFYYKLRRLALKHGELPDFVRDAIKYSEYKKNAVTKSFENLAQSFKMNLKEQPESQRTMLENLADQALKGSARALNSLPPKLKDNIIEARTSIDMLSKIMLQQGFTSDEVTAAVGANIGAYITRSFKIFDKDSGWAKEVWEDKAIIDAAMREIMATGLTQQEALDVVKELTDPSRAMGFITGETKVGRIDTTSFIKKNTGLSDAILALLGERKNPVENLLTTGNKLGKIVSAYEMQKAIREAGLLNGTFTEKKDPSNRHWELVFPNEHIHLKTEVEGNEIDVFAQRINRKMAGLREVYATPELASALQSYFSTSGNTPVEIANFLAKGWTKAVGIGKFSQVILNPASSIPSNLASTMAVEIMNGRVTPLNYARGLNMQWSNKFGGGTYSLEEQQKVNSYDGADFQKNNGWQLINYKGMEVEMLTRGALDENVMVEDINQTLKKAGFKKGKGAWKSAHDFLAQMYQTPDNAGKFNAFVFEANKWMRAYPDKKVSWAFDMAARDVRATTQTYSEVMKAFRELSQIGLLNTYMSFTHELIRNTYNTHKLAFEEIRSGNKVLVKAGWRRMAAAQMFSAALIMLPSLARKAADIDDEIEEVLTKHGVAPWMSFKTVVSMFWDSEKKLYRYFDPSYLAPQVQFLDPAHAINKADTVEEGMANALGAVMGNFVEVGILAQAVQEAWLNKKEGGGRVFREGLEELPLGRALWEVNSLRAAHIFDSAFRPGMMASMTRMMKAWNTHLPPQPYGREYSLEEELWRLLSLRPITTDMQMLSSSKLGEFNSRWKKATGIQPGNFNPNYYTQEKYDKLKETEDIAKDRVYKDLVEFMRDFRKLDIDWQKARKDLHEIQGVSIVRKEFFDKALKESASPASPE